MVCRRCVRERTGILSRIWWNLNPADPPPTQARSRVGPDGGGFSGMYSSIPPMPYRRGGSRSDLGIHSADFTPVQGRSHRACSARAGPLPMSDRGWFLLHQGLPFSVVWCKRHLSALPGVTDPSLANRIIHRTRRSTGADADGVRWGQPCAERQAERTNINTPKTRAGQAGG